MSPLDRLQLRAFDGSASDRAGLAEVVSGAFVHDRWVRDPLFDDRAFGPLFAAGALDAAERAHASPATHFCLLATDEARIIGVCLGHIEANLEDFTGVRVGTIWSLAVAAPWRRRGLGRRLFQSAKDWMKDAGCRQLNVSTDTENPANELYRSLGCKPVHELRTWALALDAP